MLLILAISGIFGAASAVIVAKIEYLKFIRAGKEQLKRDEAQLRRDAADVAKCIVFEKKGTVGEYMRVYEELKEKLKRE